MSVRSDPSTTPRRADRRRAVQRHAGRVAGTGPSAGRGPGRSWRRRRRRWNQLAIMAVLGLIAFVGLFPFLFMLVTSLKTNQQYYESVVAADPPAAPRQLRPRLAADPAVLRHLGDRRGGVHRRCARPVTVVGVRVRQLPLRRPQRAVRPHRGAAHGAGHLQPDPDVRADARPRPARTPGPYSSSRTSSAAPSSAPC